MIIKGYTISARIIVGVVGVIIVVALILFGVRSCDARRNAAAQARVDASQAAAASESAKDASQTQSTVNANEVASEAVGRSNEKEIRNAQGSSTRVDDPAHNAGLVSLCRRAVNRDREQCKLLNAR